MFPKLVMILLVLATGVVSQGPAKRPLEAADVDDIARLVMLEDTRQLDAASLGRTSRSKHPEVRRRTAIAIGRIARPEGGPLLAAMREDPDPAVAAAVVFATGQLKDPASVPWLADVLGSASRPESARQAAIALGKFPVPEARAALARYLLAAAQPSRSADVVGEALLSIGRFPAGGDLAPVLRWTGATDGEIRWRAAWALFRPRDPAAFPELLRLSRDPSAEVRFWAMRGLTPPAADAVNAPAPQGATTGAFDREAASARLREALRDRDRQVRTEALRALGQFDDDASFAAVMASIDSTDPWLSVSAVEAMGRHKARAGVIVPRLVAASAAGKPLAMRISALPPLAALAPDVALDLATALGEESSLVARTAARQALGRLGAAGKERLNRLGSARVSVQPVVPPAARPALTEADYRRIVQRWIVPAYAGAPGPRAIWETTRGTIELELYPADAPLGTEHFVRMNESGDIVGTEFGRVVPNFVAQQRAIRDDVTLRDEVNQRGLTRGNLSWASAGLDTGRPGYTLGVTPQPHNEGNFTALGRVTRGMDVVERLELADRITAARMVR